MLLFQFCEIFFRMDDLESDQPPKRSVTFKMVIKETGGITEVCYILTGFPLVFCLCCRFARRPEQWKRSQASKETIYKEFQAAFGPNTRLQEQSEPSQRPSKRRKGEHEKTSDGTDHGLDISNSISSLGSEFPGLEVSMTKWGILGDKQHIKRERPADATTGKDFGKKKFLRNSTKATPFVRNSGNWKSPASELADLAGKRTLS